MKVQYLLGFAPIFVQGLENWSPHIENVTNTLKNMEISNSSLNSIHQQCSFPEYDDFVNCASDFIEVVEEFIKDLSNEEIKQMYEIYATSNSNQETARQLISLLNNPTICIPEFLEALPQVVFCTYECDDGYCEANEYGLSAAVEVLAAGFGCELILDPVCEAFYDIIGDAEGLTGVIFASLISVLGIFVN
eukprot:snap_masked-scaffold_22-processed-gene-4.22-mRNA-1 protein AED:1.00 eAED:1.00 QI:0/-1/0/0/-1/1/1/0/190